MSSENIRMQVGSANVSTLDPGAEQRLEGLGLSSAGRSQALEGMFHGRRYDARGSRSHGYNSGGSLWIH